MFNRAYNICSTFHSLHKEIQTITKILTSNNFPKPIVEKHIGNRLSAMREVEHPPLPTVNKAVVYIPLYYLGPHSLKVKKTLNELLTKFYPQINARIIFKTKRKIANLFQYKDSIEDVLKSLIVYLYVCPFCEKRYVGSSSRQLLIRIREHQGISYRTNRPYSNPSYSAIREHSDECHGPFTISQSGFSIVKTVNDVNELLTAEAIASNLIRPEICKRNTVQLQCFES